MQKERRLTEAHRGFFSVRTCLEMGCARVILEPPSRPDFKALASYLVRRVLWGEYRQTCWFEAHRGAKRRS